MQILCTALCIASSVESFLSGKSCCLHLRYGKIPELRPGEREIKNYIGKENTHHKNEVMPATEHLNKMVSLFLCWATNSTDTLRRVSWPLLIAVFPLSPLPKFLYMLLLCIQQAEWVNEETVHVQHEMLKTSFHKWIPVYNCPIKKCSSFTNQVILDLGKPSDRRYSQAIVKQAKKSDISQESWLNT